MNHSKRDVTVGEWIVIFLLMIIPIVNIILLFVWAFGSENTPESQKNWAKAKLIFWLILMILPLLLWIILGAAFLSFLGLSNF